MWNSQARDKPFITRKIKPEHIIEIPAECQDLPTEFYFTLLPQPGEQARHLGNLVKNPTSACANPVEVITNIENWRVSVQVCKESTGQMPIQEDIKTAFEKPINPVEMIRCMPI